MSDVREWFSNIPYQFSLLPKWIRACFWAVILTIIIASFLAVCIAAVWWVTHNIPVEIIVGLVGFGILFTIALNTVWNDIADEKPKNDEAGDE